MHVSKILLNNFRSYSQKLLELDSKQNLILGINGAGKTNILESIYFLSSGKSFRSHTMSQLINWDQTFCSVRAKLVKSKNDETEIEVKLIKDPQLQSKTINRKFLIGKVEKPRKNYLGTVKTVIFHPEDIRLINGSPGRRRDFLDSIFSQTEWRYTTAVCQYNKALKHRNELLDQVRSGANSKSELFYWDQSLIKNAKIIQDHRFYFVRSANHFFANHPDSQIKTIFINYSPSIISQEKLDKNYQTDLIKGYTQCGVHRDDFSIDNTIFPTKDKNLAFWGSRGQQRLATLAIRLAQIDYLENSYNDKPILLLDDIFSELDDDHKNLVSGICQKYQTIFTSSDSNTVEFLPKSRVINL